MGEQLPFQCDRTLRRDYASFRYVFAPPLSLVGDEQAPSGPAESEGRRLTRRLLS